MWKWKMNGRKNKTHRKKKDRKYMEMKLELINYITLQTHSNTIYNVVFLQVFIIYAL